MPKSQGRQNLEDVSDGPRSLLLRNRPIRHAYLVDMDVWNPEDPATVTLVGGIVARAQQSWHGLVTPIIPHWGARTEEADWTLLRYSDLDYLHAAAPLAESLVERVADEISPVHLDVARVHDFRCHFEERGTGVPLAAETLAALSRGPLLIFDLAKDCDPLVKRFVEWNFGAFDQWFDTRHPEEVRRYHAVELFLEKVTTKRFPISDRASLAAFLNAAAGSRPARGTPYIHPVRFAALCELAGTGQMHLRLRGSLSRQYLVYIGDTLSDFTSHWNYAWFAGNVGVPYEHQLWLPATLARDQSLHDALNNWFRRFTNWGNSDPHWLTLASASLTRDELTAVAEPICKRAGTLLGYHLRTVEEETSDRARIQRDLDYAPPLRGNEADVYRRVIHGASGVVEVSPAEPFGAGSAGGAWMVDVQGQHAHGVEEPDQFRPWLLPRRAGALAQHIFRAPARINRTKVFSVEVGRNWSGVGRESRPELRIRLPHEGDILRWFLTCERSYSNINDPRAKLGKQTVVLRKVQPSQNGRLTQGLVGLFGDLGTAHHFLSQPFWQKLFRELAALDPKRDQNLIRSTQNLLGKELREMKPPPETIERVARRVAGLLTGRAAGQYRTLRQCERLRLQLAKSEREQGSFAAGATQRLIVKFGGFSRERMLRDFDDLVRRNILRLGGALTCTRCGVRHWHNLRAMDQTVSCPGCDRQMTMPIDLQWSVELNGLARASVAQGVLGVIQALSGASMSSQSFFWGPSYELFRPGDSNPWHEVDVAALIDGELVLGEVKEGHVGPRDFDSLAEVSEALRPARAIFFISQAEWRSELRAPFDAAKERLARAGVALELHHLVIL